MENPQIISIATTSAVSALMILMSIYIFVTKDIRLIHSYHRKHVATENIPKYASLIALSLFVLAIGILIATLVNFFLATYFGYIGFGICFVISMILFLVAQYRYNGSIF